MDKLLNNSDLGKLILRSGVGMMMLFHGIAKLNHGVGPLKSMLASAHLPEFFAYGIFFGEVLAPLMLIVGYKTRIAGLLVAFTMLAAIFLAHSGDLFSLSRHGGWAIELPALYLASALAIVFMGAGRYSLDKS